MGRSFQQEFLSELETGTELLQSHAQLVLGNALSHAAQQMMEPPSTGSQTSPEQHGILKVGSFPCGDDPVNVNVTAALFVLISTTW